LNDQEMEMGVGIHGEPGKRRVKLNSAHEIADEMMSEILSDLDLKRGQPCLLLVNGFGGTPLMELYIMANAAGKILAGRGLTIARALAGSYVTSLEMAGCSLTVTALDDEILTLWDAPVHTAALRKGM
jgi:phosphoenolpyruvate---glycerone phosphotransferase subunit DhaK